MAKSIRSKWRRKCRAIKRERYGKKELERLKKTLGINDSQSDNKDVNMTEISDVVNVVEPKSVKKSAENEEQMETDSKKRVFNPRTLRDQHGAYPVWLHPRKTARSKSKKGKRGKKGKH
ncbi:protein LLP homolog [Tribolium castaneum]|uniref:Uncharacterized protein C12orf31 homolog-like Protein n=1 Tax=Tribolium castaneum TaxID=7070 RepID=D6WWY4_TRICA|nr:PREDICTED: uncharacterized protein C12orf31 homolog [Tribolium castaneum]XP_967840.1 PREDICTED: uncharacterized protein C12orf31 homolog [Tribolium castaneum]EFA08764.1 Uncharacterized protein C12orf31 homolog-like Protein [Tribolium castaneum]|eukprot:XP_008197054.1 PREDICTED: uncharacterized protein C12orf31 homolog [Tribolium castaneum]